MFSLYRPDFSNPQDNKDGGIFLTIIYLSKNIFVLEHSPI